MDNLGGVTGVMKRKSDKEIFDEINENLGKFESFAEVEEELNKLKDMNIDNYMMQRIRRKFNKRK